MGMWKWLRAIGAVRWFEGGVPLELGLSLIGVINGGVSHLVESQRGSGVLSSLSEPECSKWCSKSVSGSRIAQEQAVK